jgi:mono/diheme cytochrome c family protein
MGQRRIGVTTLTLMFVAGVIATALSFTRLPGSLSAAPRAQQHAAPAPQPLYDTEDDYGYGSRLTDVERAGRDTWYFWTGGNQQFWVRMAELTEGNVDLLNYVDSRRHGRRFRELGAVTQPGCLAATGPDEYGLWMDTCAPDNLPEEFGEPAGIVGLRRFRNPRFDRAAWDADKYRSHPKGIQPPYLIGMACGFCHVGFSPLKPPADPERPKWSELAGAIGNQYWEEGRLFSLKMTPKDFRWHLGNRQPPGTSDTSRFATDHVHNPSNINAVFLLGHRPTAMEKMPDGTERAVPHILKDGADSVGVAGASLRVYVNIGMCSDLWLSKIDPVAGLSPQSPFRMAEAREKCEGWRSTEARMEAAEAFLKTLGAMYLADAPGGARYLGEPAVEVANGARVFARECAQCHSSKQPPTPLSDPGARKAWFEDAVQRPDFLTGNFLSDDRRYSVRELGTNVARAMATNAQKGHVWEEFSSETYKQLAPAGTIAGLYNPRKPDEPISVTVSQGGYYRTPSLVSMWATAPYLHNNALGTYVKDPSVAGRMAAFNDAVEKLLWPEKRLGVQSIIVTSVPSELKVAGRDKPVQVPAGTPVDLIARVDPTRLPAIVRNRVVLNLLSDETLFRGFLRNNVAPDFVLDRGHIFGAQLADEDKRALIAYLKRL